jgi:hypothetical protein
MRKSRIKRKKLEKILYYPYKSYRNAVRILKILEKQEKATIHAITVKLSGKWEYPHKQTKAILQNLKKLGYVTEYGSVSNPDHICQFCNNSTKYLVETEYLQSSIKRMEENNRDREKAKTTPKYDPSHFFHCRDGYLLGRLLPRNCYNCGKYIDSYLDEEYKILHERYWMLTTNGLLALLVLHEKNKLFEFTRKHVENKTMELIFVLLQSQEKHIVNRLIKKLHNEMPDTNKIWKTASSWYDEVFDEIMSTTYSDQLHKPLTDYQKKYYMEYSTKKILKARGKRYR